MLAKDCVDRARVIMTSQSEFEASGKKAGSMLGNLEMLK